MKSDLFNLALSVISGSKLQNNDANINMVSTSSIKKASNRASLYRKT